MNTADKNNTKAGSGSTDDRCETRKAVDMAASLSKENRNATWEGLSAKPANSISRWSALHNTCNAHS